MPITKIDIAVYSRTSNRANTGSIDHCDTVTISAFQYELLLEVLRMQIDAAEGVRSHPDSMQAAVHRCRMNSVGSWFDYGYAERHSQLVNLLCTLDI